MEFICIKIDADMENKRNKLIFFVCLQTSLLSNIYRLKKDQKNIS